MPEPPKQVGSACHIPCCKDIHTAVQHICRHDAHQSLQISKIRADRHTAAPHQSRHPTHTPTQSATTTAAVWNPLPVVAARTITQTSPPPTTPRPHRHPPAHHPKPGCTHAGAHMYYFKTSRIESPTMLVSEYPLRLTSERVFSQYLFMLRWLLSPETSSTTMLLWYGNANLGSSLQ